MAGMAASRSRNLVCRHSPLRLLHSQLFPTAVVNRISNAYYTAAHYVGRFPNTNLLFDLCPSSIMCMGLDNASVSAAVVVWLFICASNAVLYALPGVVVALILRFRSSNRDTTAPAGSAR